MLFADGDTNGVGWMSICVAVAAALGTAWNSWNARKVARDKLEFEAKAKELENKAACDKMAFDTKFALVEHRLQNSEADRKNLHRIHEKCEERSAVLEQAVEDCEKDRNKTKSDIATLKMTVVHIAEQTGVKLE